MDKKTFIKQCLKAGIPIKSIGEMLGISAAGVKYIAKNGASCPAGTPKGCTMQVLSDLTISERKAVKALLRFVPADVVSKWLNLCFRIRHCKK